MKTNINRNTKVQNQTGRDILYKSIHGINYNTRTLYFVKKKKKKIIFWRTMVSADIIIIYRTSNM